MRWQSPCILIVLLVALWISGLEIWAQTAAPAVSGEQGKPASLAAPTVTTPPPSPISLSVPPLDERALRLPMNPIFLGVLVLSLLVWIVGVSWLNKDALENMIHRSSWTLAMYGVGIAGLAAVHFLHGQFVWALLGGVLIVLVAYICKRNMEVHPSKQVWTLTHIDRKLGHIFSRLRIIRPTKAAQVSEALANISLYKYDGEPAVPEVGRPHGRDLRALEGLKEVICRGVTERAGLILLEPKGKEIAVRMRIDGIYHSFPSIKSEIGARIMSCARWLAGLDTATKNPSLDLRFTAKIYAKPIDVRVSVQPSPQGEIMSLRLYNRDTDLLRLDFLGMRSDQLERMRRFLHGTGGLCLVCGPPESGKTTTMYAALLEIDPRERSVYTIENKVEFRLPNVTQTAIGHKTATGYGYVLRSYLKQDPKVIMVAEMPEPDTARTTMSVAMSGRVVLSSIQAPDAISGLFKLLDLKVEPQLIVGAVKLIVAQRLVRLLCTNCRQPARLQPEQLRKLGIVSVGSNVTLFRARGCAQCHGTGHLGRTGIYEMLELTPKIKDMFLAKATADAIKKEARRAGFLTLMEDGLKKVVNGLTSIEEINRVIK